MQKFSSDVFSKYPFLGFKSQKFDKLYKKEILKIERLCINKLSQIPLS